MDPFLYLGKTPKTSSFKTTSLLKKLGLLWLLLFSFNTMSKAQELGTPNAITFLENSVNAAFGSLFPASNSSYTNGGTPSFSGKTLSLIYVNQAGTSVTGISEDQLGVINVGTGAGEVNVVLGSPNTVKVGATTVATYPSSLSNSGASGNNLLLTWVGSPTLAQVNAVLNQIGYQTTSNNPTATRYVKITILDGSTTINFTKTVTVTAQNDAPQAGANTVRSDVTGPSDPIQIWPAGSTSPFSEQVTKAIDNNINTKYLNWGAGSAAPANSGFVVTPATGATIITKLTFTSANDDSGRDPLTFTLEGSRDGGGSYATIIAAANTNLSTTRFAQSESAEITNQEWYSTYRLTFPQLRSGPLMQIGEVELLGVPYQRVVYTLGVSAPVIVHNLLPVTDVDTNDQIQSATVSITTNFNQNDVLTWTNQAGITGTYNASTGVLSFTGTATPAVYQTLLRSVKFATAAPNSAGKQRLITFQVVDAGGLSSNVAEARVVVSFPPTLTSIANLGTATRTIANTITYAMLSEAAQNFTDADAEDSPLKFKIKSVGTNGTLTKGGVTVGAGTVLSTGESLVWTPSTTANNVVVMAVRAFDGDLESAADVSVTMNVQNLPPPVITSFTPTTAGNGETVVITGTGFAGVNEVKFGNVNAASFVVNSSTQITAVVGTGASGDVLVQNSGGSDTEGGFVFKIVEYKFENNVLDATSANKHGSVSGNLTYGTGIEGQAICFNRNSSNFVVLPSNLIRNLSDFTISMRFKTTSKGVMMGYQNSAVDGSANEYIPILVVQSNGTLRGTLWTTANRDMSVVSSAVVNDGIWHRVDMSITPTSINIYLDGTLVGSNTSGTVAHLSMSFNQLGRGRTDLNRDSSGGDLNGWQGFSGCIDNFVILDKGQSLAQINQITALPPPTIASFAPTTAKSGETVVITGTNLGSTSAVKIGGVNARSFTVVSGTEVRAIVGKNATVSTDIEVTTGGGAVTSSTFTFDCGNNAIDFDGINDYVTIPRSVSNDFTIEYWVKTSQSSRTGSQWYNGDGIVDAEVAGFANDFGTSLLNGKLAFGIGGGPVGGLQDVTITSTTSINTGNWTHVAVTWVRSSGAMKLYINGVLEATRTLGAYAARTAPPNIRIGSMQTAMHYFKGTIDELRIWDTERTAQQILAGMGTELVGNDSGLIAYYNFNQGTPAGTNTSITTLSNLTSGINLDGTLTNLARSGNSSNFVLGVWPVILTQPVASSSLCVGQGISVSAIGEQLTYQWYSNSSASNTGGTAISGATAATFTIPNTATGTNYYYVVVSGACSQTTTSNVSTVTVASPTLSYTATNSFERTFAITALTPSVSGGSIASYSISPALPTGLNFNTSTGVITGTPTVDSTSKTYTVTGTTAFGCVVTTTFTLEVFNAVAPSALSYSPATQTVRQATAITAMTPTISGGTPTYTISPALPAGLSINATTGVISGTLTAAQTGTVSYTVTASNSGGSVTATVTLVYNTAPTGIALAPATVAENAASGTTVGTLTATDADTGDTFTYALVSGTGSTDNASFSISGTTLSTAAVFDFETKSSYSVRVRVTDAGGLTFERALTITVTNVNEAPSAVALSASTVAENAASGTTVGTLSATDIDANDTFTYTLVSGTGSTDNASFSISGTTLTTAAVFDFETKSSYSVRVRVTDAGGLTFERALTITVTDVNEDNDGDGVKDDEERADGTDPLNACSFKLSSQNAPPSDAWKAADCDNDGLSNQREKDLGTDPLKADTDGDGVPDGVEVTDGTDPLDASKYKDTDGDGVPDVVELAQGTSPTNPKEYKDTDGDGVPDYIELRDGTNPNSATSFKDTDGGGVPDYVETILFPIYGLPATNPNVRGDDALDTDGDGVPDYQELLDKTDPKDPSSVKDTDGDGVPDFVERKEGTNPNDAKSVKDSDGDGVPDHIQARSVQLTVRKDLVLAWGTKNHLTQLPTTVEVGIFSGEKTNFQVVWNKTETLNILKRGTYELTGTLVLPKGYYNPYKVNGLIRVVVLPKPAPRDVTINNSTFVGSTTSFFIPVGAFVVNDPVDNIHVVSLFGDGYDNKYFEIKSNILFWSSAERAPGKTKFSIVVRVLDRDGNTIEKFFEINRTRPDFNSLTIYNTFTPNGDRYNDTWGVPEVRFYEGARISVYERGGARVFYTENPDVRWDGTYEGKEMPVGSYYWVIQIEENGLTRRGIVNLLRK